MKKETKKKIINLIGTLMEAQKQAGMLLQEKENPIRAKNLLADCQDCAIQIGEIIEKSEGTGTKAVSLLEIYCENLYHMSMTDAMGKEHLAGMERGMLDVLEQVKYEVKEELADDLLKVVFMPYKASMWDCMESVWEAAEADEECAAYVVPIPFFERSRQGEVEKECYEGGLFPDYVPVIPYGDFHLEEEQPDIIYIHNPYDNKNYVTSVHPDYYSFNLKKYTDMLVYIPYFFLGPGALPETQCNLSAYQYVDKIIVQDEEKAECLKDYVDENKIAVMGSPKVDHILKLGRNRQKIVKHGIPLEWRTKIKGKKVILFNVSISGILQNSKYAMEKIRYVLSRFENREDVVLWWRPHPLVEATLKSMRPAMYGEYMEIKNAFLSGGKGIFDETGDPGIAVAVADAYVGEASSSLIHYFGVLGKPVFFIDWEVTEEWSEDERASLFFIDCYFEDNCAWFVPNSELGFQYLCKLDLQSGDLCLVEKLPGKYKGFAGEGMHSAIIKIGESIILAPLGLSDIYIYHLNIKQAIKVPLKGDMTPNYTQIFEYQGKAFLLPLNYPMLIELNMETGYCIYHQIPDSEDSMDDAEYLYGCGSAVNGNCLYFPCRNKNKVWKFDMETGKFSEKKIDEGNNGYSFLSAVGDELWIASDKTLEIICWNLKTDVISRWNGFPEDFGGGLNAFRAILECGDGMAVIPRNARMAVKIDRNSSEVMKYSIQDSYEEGTKQSAYYDCGINYWMAKKYKEKIAALSAYNNSLVLHDCVTGGHVIYPLRLQEQDRRKFENLEMDKEFQSVGTPNSYIENKRWSISVFINYIADGEYHYYQKARDCYKSSVESLEGNCGKKLHDFIKGELERDRISR